MIKMLNSPNLRPNKITILNVLVRESTINALKNEYSEIEFINYKVVRDREFGKFYSEHMFGYLDYINRSLDKDHHIIRLKLDNSLGKNELLECFDDDLFRTYEVERIIEREGNYKISVECPKFFSKINREHLKNIKEMEMVKVRLFLDSSETYSMLDIIPILIPESIPIGECEEDMNFCLLKRIIENHENRTKSDIICLLCVQYYMSIEFIEKFMTYLKEKLAQKGVFIISEERIAPSPTEFLKWWKIVGED